MKRRWRGSLWAVAVPVLVWGASPAWAAGPAGNNNYWLRLEDLRLPRPKPETPAPLPVRPRPPEAPAPAPVPKKPEEGVAPGGPAPAPEPPPEEESRLHVGGAYKALAITSRTPDPGNESYTHVVNQLRLKLNYQVSPSVEARIEHDTDIVAGNAVQGQPQMQAQPRQYWSGGSRWLTHQDIEGTQRFFRAYAKYRSEPLDVTVGRQRVPLGTGRFWSTLDMLNPINPLQVERDEFIGADAVLAERKLDPLSKVSVVFAPDPAHRDSRWVGQYRTHMGESDITLTYGKYWTDHVLGVDFATQVGDAGLHGEFAYTRPQVGAPYRKALIGADYAFANTLSLSAEVYRSDRREEDRRAQWAANPQLALVQPGGATYAGAAVGYEITPLLKVSAYVLRNFTDKGSVLYPAVTYSLTDNASLMGGAQFFGGGRDTEYGAGKNLYFLRYQRFF